MTVTTNNIQVRQIDGQDMGTTTNDGEWSSNDTRCVVWATGMYFFLFFFFNATKFLFVLGTTTPRVTGWVRRMMGRYRVDE